jgi:inward rectifier potassium channel
MLKKLFKALVKQSPIVHIAYQDGRFQVEGIGNWRSYLRDPYHLFLTIPWFLFLAVIMVFYGAINAFFAFLYWIGPAGSIANAAPNSFLEMFFFSVQTLASIGYGAMYPATTYAHAIVTIEAMVGLVGIAVITGLAFARFSTPTARVRFTEYAVVTPYNKIPTLMFRTANERKNYILEANLKVYFLRDEISDEGHALRRFYELDLVRSNTPSFSLSWTVMHSISTESPLYGETQESLVNMNAAIIVSLSGIDETASHVVHARHIYTAQDLKFNCRFIDIFHQTVKGDRYIDYRDFDGIMPVTSPVNQ